MEYWNNGILGKKEKELIGLQTHHSIVPVFQPFIWLLPP
jgi:hypothetical protein